MIIKQSQLNIGTLGHVDHGKTTLTAAIAHKWTDIHSESVKRSMTIKLGYSDAVIYTYEKDGKTVYTTEKQPGAKEIVKVSLLDSPGHETLMATAIAGSNIIDAALFVISATEPCPMPQTKEHLMIINALGIKNVIIVQTKVDIVGKDKAKQHYAQIKDFIKGSKIADAVIIPVMANRNINVDMVLEEIAKIPMPERDTESDPIMYVARSFDVNKPGTDIDNLVGGVIGGSVIRGTFKPGDKAEIRPGINVAKDKKGNANYKPLVVTIESISAGDEKLDKAIAGGLIAIGTDMDPAMTKADGLVGQVIGHVGKLPESKMEISINYSSLNRDDIPKQGFADMEPVILGIGTGTVVGYVKKVKKSMVTIKLRHAFCIDKHMKISVLRNIKQRWRLYGYGTLSA